MAVNWKRIVTWLVAIVFLTVLIAFLFSGGGPAPGDILLSTIILHSTNESVARAELITAIDTAVKGTSNDAISAQWNTLTQCIADNSCTQDDYFDLVLIIAIEKKDDVPHAGLISNAITVNRYWGNQERILEFSKALSDANAQVDLLASKPVTNKWREIVACDGKCPEFHNLFFEFLRLVLAI